MEIWLNFIVSSEGGELGVEEWKRVSGRRSRRKLMWAVIMHSSQDPWPFNMLFSLFDFPYPGLL